jgi:hypothetical protein
VDLSDHQAGQLCELGKLLSYNAYGESLADLHFHPALLYAEVSQFKDPFELIAEASAFRTLQRGYHSDRLYLNSLTPAESGKDAILYVLPDQSWARRISGSLQISLPLITIQIMCSYRAKSQRSFRCQHPVGKAGTVPASTFCERFPTGEAGVELAGSTYCQHLSWIIFVRLFFSIFLVDEFVSQTQVCIEHKGDVSWQYKKKVFPRKPVLMIPLRRCGSHALRLRLNNSPEFYSPYPLHIIDFMPLLPKYGDLQNDENYFRLLVDVIGLQSVSMVKWKDIVFDPAELFETLKNESRSVHRILWELLLRAGEQHQARW